MSDFEEWWLPASMEHDIRKHDAEVGWNARGVEDSKSQSPDTCKLGHPRWALKIIGNDAYAQAILNSGGITHSVSVVCSICAEIEAAVDNALVTKAEESPVFQELSSALCELAEQGQDLDLADTWQQRAEKAEVAVHAEREKRGKELKALSESDYEKRAGEFLASVLGTYTGHESQRLADEFEVVAKEARRDEHNQIFEDRTPIAPPVNKGDCKELDNQGGGNGKYLQGNK